MNTQIAKIIDSTLLKTTKTSQIVASCNDSRKCGL